MGPGALSLANRLLDGPQALLAVYDKTGIAQFAAKLIERGWGVIATQGTAEVLRSEGLEITSVQEFIVRAAVRRLIRLKGPDGEGLLTSGQIGAVVAGEGRVRLDHRLLTLHEIIHAGLLAPYTAEAAAELAELGLSYIDMACVDLYPLRQTIEAGRPPEEVVEATDIGGPALLSSGAKGEKFVLSQPEQRRDFIAFLEGQRDEASVMRYQRQLAREARKVVAEYFALLARYHSPWE